MFQRLCTYFQDTGVLKFGGYVFSGHCSRQQISGKNEGYLLSEGYLFTGLYGISKTATAGPGADSVLVDHHVRSRARSQRPALLQAASETTANAVVDQLAKKT